MNLTKVKCPECEAVMSLDEDVFGCSNEECGHTLQLDEATEMFEAGNLIALDESCDTDHKAPKKKKSKDDEEIEDDEDEEMSNESVVPTISIETEKNLHKLARSHGYELTEEQLSLFLIKEDIDVKDLDTELLTDRVNEEFSKYKGMSDDFVKAINESGEFTEEQISELSTVFEAAVDAKANHFIELIERDVDQRVDAEKERLQEEMSNYLEVVVEEWIQENQVQIDESIEQEKATMFLDKVKDLFEECYVSVDEDKSDLVEELVKNIDEMKQEMNDLKVELSESNDKLLAIETLKAFNEAKEGLAETEVEKFQSLVEDIDSSDIDNYKNKLSIIKNKFFGVKTTTDSINEDVIVETTEDGNDEAIVNNKVDDQMAEVLKILAKK